jgi:hypothetical protein
MSTFKEINLPENIDDILEKPSRFGLPTFEEFKKNPEKYLGRDDEALASVDEAGFMLKNILKRVKFEIEGYRCKTLEEVERVAKNQGIPLKELDYYAQLVPQGGGNCDVVVKFMSKSDLQKHYEKNLIERKMKGIK